MITNLINSIISIWTLLKVECRICREVSKRCRAERNEGWLSARMQGVENEPGSLFGVVQQSEQQAEQQADRAGEPGRLHDQSPL